jgi:hypothetical protein
LQPFDACLSARGKATDLSGLLLSCHHFVSEDRELGTNNLLVREVRHVRTRKRKDDVIQCRTQVVHAIADQDTEAVGDDINARYAQQPMMSANVAQLFGRWIGIRLINDSIRLTFDPGIGLLLKGLQVFARPL